MPSTFPSLGQVALPLSCRSCLFEQGCLLAVSRRFWLHRQGDQDPGWATLMYAISSQVPERHRHMMTWQTATREYLHTADLPLEP